ncbi:Protein FAR1-like sequence 5 [Apostasia shenzhenica]|uniref:Protein FAR1-like sequence 5 n=1 Tax=Apostasia shenzhenica TaxID=1088818 RepID=A0A2I0A092_9ASPA|nr:Protein FAR1-like sequence 5 [Apostasia shenzhenica]
MIIGLYKFIEKHNHPLATPKDRHLLRSHRDVREINATVLRSLSKVGVRTCDVFAYIVDQADDIENIEFSKRDAYNFINREKLLRIEASDASSLLKLFRGCRKSDPFFEWDAKFDEEQRLTNFLWVDGHCKVDYDAFGDVIIFDISYQMNTYNLACAPLIVVNNHKQNAFFWAAFLVDNRFF